MRTFNIFILIVLLAIHSNYATGLNSMFGATLDKSAQGMRGYTEGDTGDTDWDKVAQNEMLHSLQQGLQIGKAKNVIIFIGDGLGPTTVTAARAYHAQSRKLAGNDAKLAFEKFPVTGLSMTYNTDVQVPDSAATATAFLCGQKAKSGTLGVNQLVPRSDCGATAGNEVKSMFKHAMDEGKHVGIVTSTRITHATPGAAYASSSERNWEADSDIPLEDRDTCVDIAKQLVDGDYNKDIRVIFGGGRYNFLPNDTQDPEHPGTYGKRVDGRNLVEDWKDEKYAKGYNENNVKYVQRQSEFDALDLSSVEYVMGLFEPSHMNYEADREEDVWGEPSLAELTEAAIKVLQKGKDGFFLLVEGGRIDHAHHDSLAYKSLNDTVALSDAVQKALDLTDIEDTLIVVTADHSHAFVYNGYQNIDSDVTGIATDDYNPDGSDIILPADDGKPTLTLSYTNGPGYKYHRMEGDNHVPRKDLTADYQNGIIGTKDYLYDAGIWLDSETHGGEDVAIYARGPMAYMFNGVHEQNYIAHALMYASCVGNNKDHCDKPWSYPGCPASQPGNAASGIYNNVLIICLTALLSIMFV